MRLKTDRDANLIQNTAEGKTVNRWVTQFRQQRSGAFDPQGRSQSADARIRQPGACLTRPDGGRSCLDI